MVITHLYTQNKNIERKQYNQSNEAIIKEKEIVIKLHKYYINKHMHDVFRLSVFPGSFPAIV